MTENDKSWKLLEERGWRKRLNSKTNRISYVRPNNGGIVSQKRHLTAIERDEIGDILFPGKAPKVQANPNPVPVAASDSTSTQTPGPSRITRPSPSSSHHSWPSPSSSLNTGPCPSTSDVPGPSLPVSHIFCDVSDPSSSSFCHCGETSSKKQVVMPNKVQNV